MYTCKDHSTSPASLVCMECFQLICKDCALLAMSGKHSNHLVVVIKDAQYIMENKLQVHLDDLKNELTSVKEKEKDLLKRLQEVQNKKKELEDNVKEYDEKKGNLNFYISEFKKYELKKKVTSFKKVQKEILEKWTPNGDITTSDPKEVFNMMQFKLNDIKYILFNLDKEATHIYIEHVGDSTKKFEDFIKLLPEDECRFGVIYITLKLDEGGCREKILFIDWSPNTAKLLSKTYFSMIKENFKQKLDGISVEMIVTEIDQLTEEKALEIGFGKKIHKN